MSQSAWDKPKADRITLNEVNKLHQQAFTKYQSYQHALEAFSNAKQQWEAQQRNDFQAKRTAEALALFEALTPAQRAKIIRLLETHNK